MAKTSKYMPIGTIISDTVNPEHTIPVLCDFLVTCIHEYEWTGQTDQFRAFEEYYNLIQCARAAVKNEHSHQYDSVYLELCDAIESFCAPYTTLGFHPYDGADLGIWPMMDHESLDDARESGYRVEISDHGNVTLYDAADIEIWSVV